MQRFLGVAERWNAVEPPNVLVIAAATPTVVFPDQRRGDITTGEIAYRYIQNVGAQRLYYSFGVEGVGSTPSAPVGVCDNVNMYHGFIEAGQALECGHHRQIVTVYSPAGTTVATVLIWRNSSQPNS